MYDAIVNDEGLNALGIDGDTVFANYSLDEPPTDSSPFLILRWENEDAPVIVDPALPVVKNTRLLTIWAHYPVAVSTDFNRIDAILDGVEDVLRPMEHVEGEDGETLTCVRVFGRSPDFKDDGFQTISRNAIYQVLSRKGVQSE